MSEISNEEVKAAGPNGRVVPVHSTSVDSSSAWDRTAQFRKMRSPATPSYYNDIFAFQLPNTKGTRKTHYSFVHHFVDSDGSAGAASGRALSNSVAVLNGGRQGTVLRGAARQGVYRHIAAHYKDADREAPELKSDEDVDAIMMFKGLINEPLTETLDLTVKGMRDLDNIIDVESGVSWFEGDSEMKGIVIEAEDDIALVEQVDDEGKGIGEFYELEYSEMKLRTFVVMEKADEMLETGAIVSWDTSKGKYYGDVVEVVTDGMARGEPQGLEIEGSEENPAYVIRVWMQEEYEAEEEEPEDEEDMENAAKSAKSEGEWHSTNVTVVARGDALKVEEALPTGGSEDDYDSEEEEEDEETAMKSIDPEFSALVKRVIEQNAEVLKRLAEFDSEEKSDAIEETPAAEETVVEEVKSEEVAVTTEEVVADETPAVEIATEEVKSEEVVAEEAKTEETPAEEQPAVEAKSAISFDDLKEFHNLLKEVAKQ